MFALQLKQFIYELFYKFSLIFIKMHSCTINFSINKLINCVISISLEI